MDRIGKYETISQLGKGAMGTVYLAHDTNLDRDVALKTIRTGTDVNPEVRERFYREARACARLQHPNIITVYDLDEDGGVAFIAMELLRGADFRQLIQDRKPLPLEQRLTAMAQVCDAIAHAHSHGVIHRDIKPSNLYLTEAGQAKVLDFGIARLPSSKLTVVGQVLGTPNYMAPEQLLGQPSDGRADLFSVAVVLFEFITYTHPFKSQFIPRRITQGDPDSLFDHDATLPPALAKVTTRGLSRDPNKRYQSAAELAADLRAVLDGLHRPATAAIELPSVQSPVQVLAPPPAAAQTSRFKAPEGEDAADWRLSQALRLLPEFDAAMDRGDVAAAKAKAADFEACVAGDIRFAEAVYSCRQRLEEMERAPAARAKAASGAGVGTAMRQGVASSPAVVTSQMVAPAQTQPTVVPVQTATAQVPAATGPVAVLAKEPEKRHDPATVLFAPSQAPVAASSPSKVKWMVLAGGGVCTVLAVGAGLIWTRPVTVEPAVAVATVRAGGTWVYAQADLRSTLLEKEPPGAQINIRTLPVSRDQSWVMGQPVQPKAERSGYLSMADLEGWHGLNGSAALALPSILFPGESGTREEIENEVRQYQDAIARFPTEPAADEARVDIARLRIALAMHLKSSGLARNEWDAQLQDAEKNLQLLAGNAKHQGVVSELGQRIKEIRDEGKSETPQQVKTPVAQPRQTTSRESVGVLMRQAKDLRESGNYVGARQALDRLLRIDPRNAEAIQLRQKLDRAMHDERQ